MKVTIEEGAIYRDSDGRDRTEWIDPTRGVIDSAMIRDPRSAVLILLDLYRKRAVVEDIGPTPMGIEFYGGLGDKSQAFDLNRNAPEKGVPIGDSKPEGFACRDYRVGVHDVLVEYSYSEDLREILAIKSIGPGRERTLRVFNIRQGEPDRDLFEIPPGYAITRVKH